MYLLHRALGSFSKASIFLFFFKISGFVKDDDDSSAEISCAMDWVRSTSLGGEEVRNANESRRSEWIGLRRGFWGLKDGEDEQMPKIKAIGDHEGLNFWVEKILGLCLFVFVYWSFCLLVQGDMVHS